VVKKSKAWYVEFEWMWGYPPRPEKPVGINVMADSMDEAMDVAMKWWNEYGCEYDKDHPDLLRFMGEIVYEKG